MEQRCRDATSSLVLTFQPNHLYIYIYIYNYTPRARLFEHLLQLRVSCFLRSNHQATARNNGYNHRNLKYRTTDTYVTSRHVIASYIFLT